MYMKRKTKSSVFQSCQIFFLKVYKKEISMYFDEFKSCNQIWMYWHANARELCIFTDRFKYMKL